MLELLWDASALAKRYLPELGSASVNAAIGFSANRPMLVTLTGYVETYSILRRRFNSGILSRPDYLLARSALRLEVVESLQYQLLSAEQVIFQSLPLIETHNVNSSDAVILAVYLDYQRASPNTCVLIGSDHRLLRAARAEGLPTLDPEVVAAADVPAFLAAL